MVVLEYLALLAPVLALVVLIGYRKRAPRAAAVGLVGALSVGVGSLIGLVAKRAVFFGGGEGLLDRMELWTVVRMGLVVVGVAILLAAVRVGEHRPSPVRGPLVVTGVVAAVIGLLIQFLPIDLESQSRTVQILLTVLIETVEFGLLGVSTILLALAVVSGRRAGTPGEVEPSERALGLARRGWELYRSTRSPRR